MTDWKPLFFSLFTIIIIGVLLPLVLSGIVDTSTLQPSGLYSSLINFIENGISFFNQSFNLIPMGLRSVLIEYITIMSVIPSFILVPIVILTTVGTLYSLIKLIPFT